MFLLVCLKKLAIIDLASSQYKHQNYRILNEKNIINALTAIMLLKIMHQDMQDVFQIDVHLNIYQVNDQL